MVPQGMQIIARARQDIGIKEDPLGSNDGQQLRAILHGTPFIPGQPWCYYWVLAVMLFVFKDRLHIPLSIAFTGSCQVAADNAAHQNKLSRSPATGSIFLLMTVEGHFHHAGIVIDVDEFNGVIHTIEGNTNQSGSPEGIGVFLRHREMTPLLRYIIW